MRSLGPLFPASGLLLAGCRTESATGAMVLEIARSSAWTVAFTMILWALLFALLGLILAGLLLYVLSGVGLLGRPRATPAPLRAFCFLLMGGAFTLSLGTVGLLEGIHRGCAGVLARGEVRDRLYPAVGGAGADLVAAVSLAASGRDHPEGTPRVDWRRIEAFREGAWELNIGRFISAVETGYRGTIDGLIDAVAARNRSEALESELGRGMLRWSMAAIGAWLIRDAVAEEAGWIPLGAIRPGAVFRDLRRAGRARGDPEKITHGELSVFLMDRLFAAPLLWMVRSALRGVQAMALIPMAVGLVVPVLVLGMAGRR